MTPRRAPYLVVTTRELSLLSVDTLALTFADEASHKYMFNTKRTIKKDEEAN